MLVDYIIATGETMRTMARLVEQLGGKVAGIFAILELGYLNPRRGLEKYDVHTIVKYKSWHSPLFQDLAAKKQSLEESHLFQRIYSQHVQRVPEGLARRRHESQS